MPHKIIVGCAEVSSGKEFFLVILGETGRDVG